MTTRKLVWFVSTVLVGVVAACNTDPSPGGPTSPVTMGAVDYLRAGFIQTPAGWRHQSCVIHQTEAMRTAHTVSKHAPICNQRGTFLGIGGRRSTEGVTNFPTTNSWALYGGDSGLAPGTNFHYIQTTWKVPEAPANSLTGFSPTKSVFIFPGIQSFNYILQPVLQYGSNGAWGGNYWTMEAWFCSSVDSLGCNHGDHYVVYPGETLVGTVWQNVGTCDSINFCYWSVSIHDVEQNITSGVNVYDYDNYDLATPGALEQWNLGTSCNDYPPNGVTATSITVKNKSDATVYPAWHTYVDTGITQCAFETQSSASSWMRLWFNVKPISDSIADGSTNYYLAWVRGGYPNLFSEPYTYYWEYCYWDCSDGGGGGALRAATRSARRNGSVSNANGGPRLGASAVWSLDNVESGWHYLSSDNAVFWTGVSDSLRLTITDSRSNQASTVRWIP